MADAFVRLIEHGWDAEAAARPHGHRTTVIVHLDVESEAAELHLGPALTEAERRYLCCDAKFETWFERDGIPLGAARTTREIPRRLRRALERRARGCCEVPGCSATVGLHAHHLVHWEDGGPTELWNLLLCCPFHHRAHHADLITHSGTGRPGPDHRPPRPTAHRRRPGPTTPGTARPRRPLPAPHRRTVSRALVPAAQPQLSGPSVDRADACDHLGREITDRRCARRSGRHRRRRKGP